MIRQSFSTRELEKDTKETMEEQLEMMFPNVNRDIVLAVCERITTLEDAIDKLLELSCDMDGAQSAGIGLLDAQTLKNGPGDDDDDDDDDDMPQLEDVTVECHSAPAAAAATLSVNTNADDTTVVLAENLQDFFPQLSRTEAIRALASSNGDLQAAIESLIVATSYPPSLASPPAPPAPLAAAASAKRTSSTPSSPSALMVASPAPLAASSTRPQIIPVVHQRTTAAAATRGDDDDENDCGVDAWQSLFPDVDRRLIEEAMERHRGETKAAAQNAIFNNLSKHAKRIQQLPQRSGNKNHQPPSAPAPVGATVITTRPSSGGQGGRNAGSRAKNQSDASQQVRSHVAQATSYDPTRQHAAPTHHYSAPPPPSPPSPSFAASSAPAMHFHLFWDYDNTQIGTAASPLQVITEVKRYLSDNRCHGGGLAIFHVEAFFVPQSSISPGQLRDLRDVGVKIVQCSEKKGDADRQLAKGVRDLLSLGLRSDQHELAILSSDKDFTDAAEDARRAGCAVGCFHYAQNGSYHEQVLELMYSYCVSIRQLLPRALDRRPR